MARRTTPAAPTLDEATSKALRKVKHEAAMDAFANTMTGIGTSRSKLKYGLYLEDPTLDRWTLENLFKSNDLARKIVAKPVDDAMREGFSLRRKDSKPAEDKDDVALIVKRFKALTRDRLGGSKFKRAAYWARLHGGGGLILGVKGGGSMRKPLDDEDVKSIEYVLDFDRHTLTPMTRLPNGDVEVYLYQPPEGENSEMRGVHIHASRIVFFPGASTTNHERAINQGWDHSILQAVYNALFSFDQMFNSTDAMFADASQAVFKLQGLIESLAEADSEAVINAMTRLQMLDMSRSNGKAIMLEAGDEDGDGTEDFEVIERTTLGTLDKVITQYYIRLAAAAGMPLTVLLGMAPSGMDATGESDLILYFNSVDVYRQEALTEPVMRLVRMIHRIEELEGDPEDWEIVWPTLARPSEMDVATAENMIVQSLGLLIDKGVAHAAEVGMSLAQLVPNMKLVLDIEARKKALESGLKELSSNELTGAFKEPPKPETGAPGSNPEKKSARKTPSKSQGRQAK